MARLSRPPLPLEPAELRAAGRAFARLAAVPGPLSTPCWVYTRSLSTSGYAFVRAGGNPICVHRLLYRLLVGPIPPARELHHRCERPACSNPGHLIPVTHAENHALTRRARSSSCERGHPFTPENTGRYPSRPGRRMCKRCHRDNQRRARGRTEAEIAELERAHQERIAA